MIRQTLFMIIALMPCVNHAAIVLQGNEQVGAEQTFSFNIQQYRQSNASDLIGANLYVGAAPTTGGVGNVNQFSVSRVTRDTTQFLALTPQMANVNGSSAPILNPLYDQGIAHMALFNGINSILAGAPERPVVVLNSDLKTIYFINNYTPTGTNVQVITGYNNGSFFQNIPDATGAVTAGIVALESATPYVFAVASPATGVFGSVGTGIALEAVLEIKGVFTGPVVIDAPTGMIVQPGGNRATPLDVTLSSLKIGDNLASIGTIVDLCWNDKLNCLYVALQVVGGSSGTDGARALLVGQVTSSRVLTLYPIAPTSAFNSAGNQIIGNIGASTAISINKVRSMFTSTAMSYLIVQGDVGLPAATTRAVYALPLVTGNATASLNGTIADKTASPINIYTPTTIPLFSYRSLQTPATTPDVMPLSTDSAALVGGAALFDGNITDISVYGDTVFVTVQASDSNEQPGIFYSQALFQADGSVKGWTNWARAVGTVNSVQSVVLDPVTGQFTTLVANDGVNVQTVKRTQWSSGDANDFAPAISLVAQYMPQEVGGVQGLFDFVVTSTTTSTATPGLLDISALVATGLQRVMLIQTSNAVGGGVIPITGSGFGFLTQFNNGTIEQTLPIAGSNIIGMTGGMLDDLGAIVAAEIARDGVSGSNGYLFVGGIGGLAVLSNPDGSGWNTSSGLSAGFAGLTAGMSFKTVGHYTNVCKLINDGQYLYVLTNNQLDRIDLTVGNVGLGQVSPVTIATNALVPGVTIQGTFLDAVISQQLLILATSTGLVQLNYGLDVRQVDAAGASWLPISAPETIGPMQQLLVICPTGREQDATTHSVGSYLIALSAYRGKNQAQLIRYAINSTNTTGVTSSTVQQINDLYVQNIPSYFASFGQFRALTATDGSIYFGTRNQTEENLSLVTALFSTGGVQTGSRYLSNKIIPVQEIGSTIIAALLQTSATGSWLVAGDGGIQANE